MTDWKPYVRSHLPHLDIRAEREAEIIDELALQLEAAYDAAIAGGASEDEAHQQAIDEVPDWQALARDLVRVETRDASAPPQDVRFTSNQRLHVMSGFALDLRHALRSLFSAPGFAVIAILTLALGLGLGTTAFSLIDGILLQPMPYPRADRLVLIKAAVPPDGQETNEITYPDGIDLAGMSQGFERMAVLMPFAGTTTMTEPPSRVEGFEVSTSFLSVLGLTPTMGRDFSPEDGRSGAAPVVILGHRLWQRLGAPHDIIGRALAVNEVPRTVIGIAPRNLRVELMTHPADLFLPLTPSHPFAANRGIRTFRVIGRLSDGRSIEEATASVATIGARLASEYPATNRGRTFVARSMQEEIVGPARSQLWLVAGLVGLVLLVAAVNLAGLLLARTAGRLRDVRVRIALGASRWRLIRESMAEGLLLSVLGAVAGAFIATALVTVIRSLPELALPRLSEIHVSYRALGTLTVAAVVIACGAGLVPLLLMRHLAAASSLRTGHETASRPAIRLRSALIIGQTSFAFMLLAIAVLLATSLRAVLTQPLGFETQNVVTMRIAVPESRYVSRDDTVRFYTELLDTLRAQPMVDSAGVVSILPLAGNTGSTLSIQGREDTPLALRPAVGWHWTSPGYFASIGIPIIAGRDFTADDVRRRAHVTVINEALARRHFPGEDPIGKRVYFGGFGPGGPPEWHEVIGIVGDVRHRGLEAEPDARAYDLFGQHWGRTISLAIRTSNSPVQVAAVVRQLLGERDPRLAVFAISTTADLVQRAVATRRLLLWMVTGFAFISVVIALIGLYGAVAYMVAQRTKEVGVRLALGATTPQIRWMVLGRGLQLVAGGVVCGLIGTFALRRSIDAQLFGITTMNPPALTASASALLVAAALACLAPAWRATRIDPVEALRIE